MEISPDLEESHVRRNYYEHDDMNEIETKIVTFDKVGKIKIWPFSGETGPAAFY